ncbi:tRNA adenosine(34) deaminase TadA [Thiomicrorhabdus sp.]|uniref:tRNA adenosine(34) deaminase TadA n=1 Tax=Thiomicrorhabdus sp. TaxID=2039724 RepID=UPI0029C82CB0|nr:tRNA adenosine(34) deaminase TadA [Thiomicrorhabdus sp.]
MSQKPQCPPGLTQEEKDRFWMAYAINLAKKAESTGEVPVGAVMVIDDQWLAEGWNQSIQGNDPTAHAEMLAIRAAGQVLENYRMPETTLYVTLEPCPMCAGALVHARVKRIVYGAADPRTGAVDSVFELVSDDRLNHQLDVGRGVLAHECSTQISGFFKMRRAQQKAQKQQNKQILEKDD